jgi:phosphopantothenoylcysteine decarboxylase/phosphopantothenate--cysteine ligase
MLRGKKIVLGITGSIAAYKSAALIRLLVKAGAEVQTIMTPCAKEFITPLTIATLSTKPVLSEFFNERSGNWNSHVELGLWADLFVIAPATANTMAKMATGICDNLLLTTYLSMRCTVMIAPAMDLDMYSHPTTQNNIKTLQSFGNIIIAPAIGELASGLSGKGRMEEPETICNSIKSFFDSKQDNTKKKILLTAGPTYEPIDPVRFIGNHSSGKMGFALAEELSKNNFDVTIIAGPVSLPTPSHCNRINVTTANEMYEQAVSLFPQFDAAILCAAVADYAPKKVAEQKMKRNDDALTIELIPNKDIAKKLGEIKTDKQRLVGFALETENETINAQAKRIKKNLDFIVLNSLQDNGAGFKHDTNKIKIIDSNGITTFELKSKTDVAKDIITKLIAIL